MYTRAERFAQIFVVSVALLFAVGVTGFVVRGRDAPGDAGGTPAPTATPTPRPPTVKFTHDTCCAQTARYLRATWESSEKVTRATAALSPDPGFPCGTNADAGGAKGVITCQGLLRGATDYVAKLSLTTAVGAFAFEHKFKTMGDKLANVQWFTEFEDPHGDPLACAAASARIVQFYTTGEDKTTAEGILAAASPLNRSRDPGLDPVAIASIQKRLDARNNYHYYRFTSREEATKSAVYWLLRSGKPVHVITLAGQHDPLLVGFSGTFGTFYDDPVNQVGGVIVQDPQRGDMRPETASRRPDKYRTPGFQTGQLLDLGEWYRDEWWLGFTYTCCLSGVNVDRSDGAYPTPHWAGTFVIIVDDGDADNPPDREGRVQWR